MTKEEIMSEYFGELSKKGHKLKPRSKEHYQKLQQKSVEARRKNKQSHANGTI